MTPPTPSLTERAHAKLNLTLAVGPRGDDGFHAIRSLFLRIGLSDRLDARPGGDDRTDRLTVDGTVPGVERLGGDDDLVLRAVRLARGRLAPRAAGLALTLRKRIPVAAGLGGGSSDAAAALRLACRVWDVAPPPSALVEVGAELGADVPFFVAGMGAAHVTDRGESLAERPTPGGALGAVLVTPPIAMPTGRVFAAFDELREPTTRAATTTDALAAALDAALPGEELAARWAPRLRDANDLWPAAVALEPLLATLRDDVERLLDRAALLSGSGSTLFALYPSVADAVIAARGLHERRTRALERALVHAVDLVGPEPRWSAP